MSDQDLIEDRNLPSVSVVVIGRNEGRNLEACFRSVAEVNYPRHKLEVIYVDTGSSDGSVNIAKKFNVKVAEERSVFPTPGLARNRGMQEAKNEVIHFVDGDMTVEKTYLKKAVSILGKNNILIGGIGEEVNNPALTRLSDNFSNFHYIFSDIDYYLDFGLGKVKPFERQESGFLFPSYFSISFGY